MAGSPRKYGFINAKLRTRISLILDDLTIRRLSRTATLAEAVGLLKDTPFVSVYETYSKTGDLRLSELEIIRSEIALYRDLLKVTDQNLGNLIQALVGRFEGENLKAALRLWFDRHVRNRDIAGEATYLVTDAIRYPYNIDALLMEPDPASAAEAVAGTPYYQLLQNLLPDAARQKSMFDVEVALDQLFFKELYQACDQLGRADRELAHMIVGAEIDLRNIAWIVRSRSYPELSQDQVLSALIPRGNKISGAELQLLRDNTDPIMAVTRTLDSHYPGISLMVAATGENETVRLTLLESLYNEVMKRQAAKILLSPPFSAGIVLAYFILKGREAELLITILNAKYYELDESRIKEII